MPHPSYVVVMASTKSFPTSISQISDERLRFPVSGMQELADRDDVHDELRKESEIP
jgi:hypothetical protein